MNLMKPTSILESALYVDDLEAAEYFYVNVLGLEPAGKVEGRHAFFYCGAMIVLLFNAEVTKLPSDNPTLPVPVHGAFGQGHLCFRATEREMDDWVRHLEKHGVAVEADFNWPGGGRSIYFRDPSGNSLEFAEPKIWDLT